jgi:hypothetical protein
MVELCFELLSNIFGSKLLIDKSARLGWWADGWMDDKWIDDSE